MLFVAAKLHNKGDMAIISITTSLTNFTFLLSIQRHMSCDSVGFMREYGCAFSGGNVGFDSHIG